jgi:TonB-dependent receptor
MTTSRTRTARRIFLLTSAFGLAGFSPAFAQEAQTDSPIVAEDEIVVTGQRLAQERALDARRDADAILDAVMADDIGRLADKNAAESVERLPGVSLKYDQGEGRFVSIRGIDGALNNVTIGGVDLGSPDGDTRQLPLDVIGGQLLSRVEVIKAVTPDMDPQAIGGSVNIELQSPFDLGEDFVIQGSFQAGEHEFNDTTPVAADISVGGVFGNSRQFGYLFGLSYSERDFRTYGLYPDDWREVPGSNRGSPTNIKYTTYDLLRERVGAVGALEWRPNEDTRFYAQALYSVFREDEYRQRYRLDFGTLTFNPDGDSAVGVAAAGGRRQDLRLEQKDKSVFSITLGGESELAGWDADYLVSYGHNELDEPNHVWQFRSTVGATTNIDLGPLLYTATPAVEATPAQMQFRQLTIQDNVAEEDIRTAAINLRHGIGLGEESYIQFGARIRDAEKVQDNASALYDRGSAANRFTLADFNLVGAPTTTYLDSAVYHNYPTIDAAAIQQLSANNLGGVRMVLNAASTNAAATASDYTVEERVSAAYAMADLDFGRLSVIAGVRAEQTDVSVATPLATVSSIPNEGDYTNVLPGVHVRFEADHGVVLRGAYTNTIGRPGYGQLSPGASINTAPATPVISRGDPALEPYLSSNIDLALDWYFDEGGVLGFGIFHKQIEDYIFTGRVDAENVTFLGITYPVVELSQPVNAGEAQVSGIEFNYQQQFTFLPGFWSGFGVAANLTLTDSEVDVPNRGALALPRQSDTVYGAQLFYQQYGVEATLAYHFASEYLDTIAADAADDTFFNDFRRLDAKVSYDITPNLSIFVEGQNLNDETLWEYQGGRPDWQIGYEQYGRTFYAGLTGTW